MNRRVTFAAVCTLALLKCPVVFGQTPLPNPDLPVKCPYDIIFVLDESGSIMGGQAGTSVIDSLVRSGASDLITSLNGTGSRVAIVEFNSTARRAQIGGSISYQTINSNYVTAFNNYINTDNNFSANPYQYDPEDCTQCFTNWEDAFMRVQNINYTEGVADLVIFFTDGMPTAYINAGGGITQGLNNPIPQQALSDATGAANVVKTQGSHIFVVGIPNPTLPESNVQAISGPDRYPSPETDFLKGDYSVSTSATLQQDLAGLADLLTVNTSTSGFEYEVAWSNHCDTFMIQFTNKSTNATDYYWDFGDSIYSTDTNLTHLFSGSGPFVVMLAAHNQGICGISDTLYDTISVTRIPDTLLTDFSYSHLPDCDSLLVHFAGTSSDSATFAWDFGNGQTSTGNNASAVYLTHGTYDVTMMVHPMDPCFASDTLVKPFTFTPVSYPAHSGFEYDLLYENYCDTFIIQFTNTSTGATNYYWDFGDSTYSTDTSLTHLFSGAGPFVVMLAAHNEGECGISETSYDTLSFELRFDTLVLDFSYNYSPDCDSLMVQFTGSSSVGSSFAWDFGNGQHSSGTSGSAVYTIPGTYDVAMMVTPSEGCYLSDTLVKPFTFTPLSYVSVADFIDSLIYSNDCDTFRVKYTNRSSGGTSYFWDFGNGITSVDTNAIVTYTSGSYDVTLQVNDDRNCSTNDTLNRPLEFISTITRPEADFDFKVTPSCDVVELSLNNLSTGTARFEWRMNNSILSTDLTQNGTMLYYKADTLSIELTAKGINSCALDDIKSKIILVPSPYSYAVADFDFTPLRPEVDEIIQFNNLSQNAAPDLLEWDFGDGTTSNDVHPQHIYSQERQYEICLSANNEHDCPATACKDIPVTLTALVDLPNAFTPNGDDNNDVFIVRGKNIIKMHLRIFNRWGELVFESRDPYVGWDGTYKDKLQEMEVYDWLLNATLKNGQDVFRKGNVTLLR